MSQQKNEWDILEFASQTSKVIENNFKLVVGAFAALIIAASVWSYMNSVARDKEMQAFNELYKITKVYQKKKADFAEAKEAKEKPKDKKGDSKEEPKKDLVAATGDITKDYPQVVPELQAFIEARPHRNATAEAALTLSEIYSEYDQDAKGAEVLAKVLKDWDEKNVLFTVMQMRAGDLWASMENCEKAVNHWQVVASSESFVARQAQLKLGVCLQEIGRLDEARIWFEKIKDKDPNSSEGFSAKRYLRFLEFKSNNQSTTPTKDDKAQNSASSNDKAS